MTELKLPTLRKIDPNKPKKKKILLLSDDLRVHSGIATVSREIVLNTVEEYDWVQLGAALNHPDHGKVFDISASVTQETGVQDADVKIYAHNGYGNPDVLRELINIEQPDAILHFTDPRFWGWLYQMEHEVRQMVPLLYYTIWDDTPYPRYNLTYYESCDLLMCISKQTHNIVKQVLSKSDFKFEDWQVTYVPHGINHKTFFPITEEHADWKEYMDFKKSIVPENVKYVMFHNARNIRRKHTSDLILAWKEFTDKIEDKSTCMFILHTDPVDENGTDLPAVINELAPDCNIKFTSDLIPKRVLSPKELNFLYNLSDVTANIASNEGFGLGTAESVMAGTPIIVNVTGGMQDQCGFKNNGVYLTENDYTDEMPTNAEGTYRECGEWAYPVFPAVRTLQGSIPTPYIFDDIASYKDTAEGIMYWFNKTQEERKAAGLLGREFFMSEGSGLSAENMGKRFIQDINTCLEKWTPRKRNELIKL